MTVAGSAQLPVEVVTLGEAMVLMLAADACPLPCKPPYGLATNPDGHVEKAAGQGVVVGREALA